MNGRNKKLVYTFLIAIGLPLLSYYIFYKYSKEAITLPPKYFIDTIVTVVKKGKQIEDTIWHRVKDFNLTNQLNEKINWASMQDKRIVIVNFIFTRCRGMCPILTGNMKMLQDAFDKKKRALVQLISFTVDPEYDQPEILKQYADKYQVNHKLWWFLTGSTKEIYELAYNEFHVATQKNGETDFVHTDKFVVLDKHRRIRGYYSGQDSVAIKKLADDAVFLSLEKE